MTKIYLLFFLTSSATAAISPEMEALKLAPLLKPIQDAEWQTIAKDRIAEKYGIVPGDTLYDISNRLFGDGKYWPKIWAINNPSILNPHLILPGRSIAFMPGSGSNLPAITLESTAENDEGTATVPRLPPIPTYSEPNDTSPTQSDAGSGVKRRKKYFGRSQEWRYLPKQNWENVQIQLPPEVDPLGFDRKNKITFGNKNDFDLDSFVASSKLDPLGSIMGSEAEFIYLSLEDKIIIEASQDLAEGQMYSITRDPVTISSDGRSAYSYPLLGRAKVIKRLEDNKYLAQIKSSRSIINRGSYIIPLQPRVEKENLVAASSTMEGHVAIDRSTGNTYAAAQFKQVYIDRGAEDGIQIGMVFQAFTTDDPITKNLITETQVLEAATFVVVQVSEQFCTALMIKGNHTLDEGTVVTLLTDVSNIYRERHLREAKIGDDPSNGKPKAQETDELDLLDQGGELTPEEQRELQQLEEWETNPTEDAAPPPEAAPAPSMDEEIPIPEGEPIPSDDAPPPSEPSDVEPLPTDPEIEQML